MGGRDGGWEIDGVDEKRRDVLCGVIRRKIKEKIKIISSPGSDLVLFFLVSTWVSPSCSSPRLGWP